jgi:hypothetical protein
LIPGETRVIEAVGHGSIRVIDTTIEVEEPPIERLPVMLSE